MKNLFKSLILFQSECPAIALNSKVSFNTKNGMKKEFGYANLTIIHETIKPILQKYGLGFTQIFKNSNLNTVLFHESGEKISSSISIGYLLEKSDPQTSGAIITYFKRYTLAAILGIISEEDDEKNLLHTNIEQNNIRTNNQTEKSETIWLTDENYNKLLNMFKSDGMKELENACKLYEKYQAKPYAMKKAFKEILNPFYNETTNIINKHK